MVLIFHLVLSVAGVVPVVGGDADFLAAAGVTTSVLDVVNVLGTRCRRQFWGC